MFRAQSNLGGYQEVTVQVRCDENGDGFEGGASGSRRENGASGNGNTIGRSRAEMRVDPWPSHLRHKKMTRYLRQLAEMQEWVRMGLTGESWEPGKERLISRIPLED